MNIKKEVTLSAITSTEDGTPIITFHARINSNEPQEINYTNAVMNQKLYKENREKANKERAMFEDAMYAEQEQMMKEKGVK